MLEGAATLVEDELPQPAVDRMMTKTNPSVSVEKRTTAALLEPGAYGRATTITPLLRCRKVASYARSVVL